MIEDQRNIFLSYIVPCYNVEKYLPRCIESLSQQSVEAYDIEFIMINDGSTDGTLTLIKQFAERDPRVVVINQNNQGVSAARNNGLKIARGEYVFFLDGDDYMTDDASQLMFEACNGNNIDILFLNNYKVWEGEPNSVRTWVDYSKYIEAGTYKTCDFETKCRSIPPSSKLYNLNHLNNNNIVFDNQLKVGEVYSFFIHAFVTSDIVGVSHSPVMYYLKRKGDSATTTVNPEQDISILETLHTVFGYVDKYNPALRDNRAFLSPFFFMITSFCLIKYVSRTKYSKQIGTLIKMVKEDDEYNKLLTYFCGKGFAMDQNSYLALAIYYLPVRYSYEVIRMYYRFKTRKREKS